MSLEYGPNKIGSSLDYLFTILMFQLGDITMAFSVDHLMIIFLMTLFFPETDLPHISYELTNHIYNPIWTSY